MRIALGNKDARWKWFTDEKSGVKVELYAPTSLEMNDYAARFMREGKQDVSGQIGFVAEFWFRGFEGITDQDGNALPNTAEVRKAILIEAPAVWVFVQGRLGAFSDWWAEGNGGSGSAS